MRELVLELFSEEIPARMQASAAKDLERLVADGLRVANLGFESAVAYATPRRLTLHVAGLADVTTATAEEFKGPREGAPEKALEGFLRKTGVRREDLQLRDDKKGRVYFAVVEKPARSAADVLCDVAPAVIRTFPWPKSMRWGAGGLRWVRPLRSILCVVCDSDGGASTVPDFDVDGIVAGDVTYGHRFMAPAPIRITSFEQYREALADAFVMLDPAERRAAIDAGARDAASAAGLALVDDPALLTEVAGLVEHPVVLSGAIEPRFQALPPEVLTTSMREHQKFFALRDPADGRIKRFVTVANIAAPDGGATIVAGNERVLRARLSDAAFFYDNDRAKPLESRLASLSSVTFHNRIGSQADRVARLVASAEALAPSVGAEPPAAARAAGLAKADLATEMVYEFPELQGLMGRYYAEAEGEPAEIAGAIEAHYAPLGPTDATPNQPVSIAVALADKIDQLAAFWSVGEKPTGSGDPYALRRAALGVIRIILENELRLSLRDGLGAHAQRLAPHLEAAHASSGGEGDAPTFDAAAQDDLARFMVDRLRVFLRGEGLRHDVIDAVLGDGDPLADLTRARARIDALATLVDGPDGANLLAAFKRANNILSAEEAKDGVAYDGAPDVDRAEAPAETALFAALAKADGEIRPAMASEDFTTAMAAMAGLRAPLDAFFEEVVVNADDPALRVNRLKLLARIRRTMSQVADFSALDG